MSGDACASCTGRCCENVAVGITGYDAWRLATANGRRLEEFVTIASASADDPGAFRFEDGHAVLLLARSAAREQACVFLDGAGRCGTYASRPVVCRTYPMTLDGDRVVVRAGVVCDADAWDPATITEASWRDDLARYAREWEMYARLIAAWNASGLSGLSAYFAFVMRAFGAIERPHGQFPNEFFPIDGLKWKMTCEKAHGSPDSEDFQESDSIGRIYVSNVIKSLIFIFVAGVTAATALAQSDLDKLQQFKSTGTPMSALAPVPQTGPKADAIRRNLEQITLPPGFKISLYAIVPDARALAVGPQGVVTYVSTRKDQVYTMTDRAHQGMADDVKLFAPGIKKKIPNGLCFSNAGVLYNVEQNRVLAYPAAEFFYEAPDVAAAVVVPQGHLIPPEFESFNHSARYCRVGPDGKLYIALGQPFNVPPPAKWPAMRAAGMAAIIRMDQDGTHREIYASGIRNSVGLDFNPADKSLWFTDNQVDGMGDDAPPGELDHATAMGQNFGFPWYGGGHTRTVEYMKTTPPPGLVFPVVDEVAHAADLGMSFYHGNMFPAEYKGAIFSAQHGSWNRTTPVGARIMVTFLHADGTVTQKPFAEGWLDKNGSYLGRPVDVQQLRDGSLLVSDDFVGAVYRITYQGA